MNRDFAVTRCDNWRTHASCTVARVAAGRNHPVLPFVLSRVCYRVEDLLEDDPTVAKHDRFEAALRPAMLEAISLVDTGTPSEVMVAADRLIAAYFTLIPSTLALKLH